jgi:hypothetical protein
VLRASILLFAGAVFAATWLMLPGPAHAAVFWTMSKSANPTTYAAAGQVISYTYTITNVFGGTGHITSLIDDRATITDCPSGTVVPPGGITCHGTYTTTAADVAAGSITNTATLNGDACNDGCLVINLTASATVTFAPPPTGSITIVKVAGGVGTFNFTSTLPGAPNFTLSTGGGSASRSFTNLTPGTYTVSEVNLPLHWELANLTCVGDTGGTPTTVNLSARSASIGLDGGEAITCTFTNVFQFDQHIQQTQAAIQTFLTHRIELLADQGPDRARFIRRLSGALWGDAGDGGGAAPPSMPLSFTGTTDDPASQLSFSTSLSQIAAYAARNKEADPPLIGKMPVKAKPYEAAPSFDLWVEAHFNEYVANAGPLDSRGKFNIVYLGADYLFMRSVLVGFLVQYDWSSESSALPASAADGQGWMAGPYVSARLAPNLFFDARAAWGTSSNSINPFGLYTDRFATDRWLVQANLTGNWLMGNFRITPSAGLTFVSEKQLDYTDALGVNIPEQTVSLGRFAFGPEFGYRFTGANGIVYEPMVSIKGLWDFVRPNAVSVGGILVGDEPLHAMAEAGFSARATNGVAVRLVGQYDGIGSDSFHSYGGQVWLNVPLR